MKKKSALVFTGIIKTWFQNCKNILVSESCIVKNFDNKKYKSFDVEISKKEVNEDIIKDSKICNFYYNRLLNDAILNLKDIYQVDWNKRSWELFLGPWIHRYISTIQNRYNLLSYALKKYKIDKIKVANDKDFNLLSQDQAQFRLITQSDEWNLKLFTKLYLRYFHNNKTQIYKVKISKEKYNLINSSFKELNFKSSIYRKILRYFLKIFKNFNQQIFYRTYFGSKKFLILLSLINKNIPFIYEFNFKIPDSKFIHQKRKTKFHTKYKIDKFERILRELFFEFLPFFYLEKFNFIKTCSQKLILPSTRKRKIYTAGGLWYDDIFKFWLASSISNQSKLFYFQHGCNYGTTKYSYAEDLEIKLSDNFYTWGWKNSAKKTKRFFSNKLIEKKKFKPIDTKKFLVIGTCPLIFKSGLTSGIMYGRKSRIYINSTIELLKDLSSKLKFKTFFRPFPIHNYNKQIETLNLQNYVEKNLSKIKINNPKLNFIKILNEFELAIHTFDGTSFLETMALNKPSLLIMPKECLHHRKSVDYYYKRLKDAKILHTNKNSIIKFLNETNINQWWKKNNTQSIKDEFCKEFCYLEKNPIKEFIKKAL